MPFKNPLRHQHAHEAHPAGPLGREIIGGIAVSNELQRQQLEVYKGAYARWNRLLDALTAVSHTVPGAEQIIDEFTTFPEVEKPFVRNHLFGWWKPPEDGTAVYMSRYAFNKSPGEGEFPVKVVETDMTGYVFPYALGQEPTESRHIAMADKHQSLVIAKRRDSTGRYRTWAGGMEKWLPGGQHTLHQASPRIAVGRTVSHGDPGWAFQDHAVESITYPGNENRSSTKPTTINKQISALWGFGNLVLARGQTIPGFVVSEADQQLEPGLVRGGKTNINTHLREVRAGKNNNTRPWEA